MRQINYFEKLFYPKTVAIIGASEKRNWQYKGVLERGFTGEVYLVSKSCKEIKFSKNGKEIITKKCLEDISEIPDGIDHTIISVNRSLLIEIVKQCVKKKFHTIHIFSAGTGEFDKKGEEIEDEIFNIIKNSATRAIGPNCMGVYSTGGKISYNPQFKGLIGDVAFVSQSGDLTDRVVETLTHRGVNFSTVASIGNSISLTVADFIEYFDSDNKTKTIAVYMEGFPRWRKFEGRRLLDVLKKCKKPVIMLRSGITEKGRKSAKSHTGSLTTNNNIWNAVYSQTNTIPVRSIEDFIDTLFAFSYCKNLIPKINGLVLATWSGGAATVATDLITQMGVGMPEIQEPLRSRLKDLLKAGSTANPIDLPFISGTDKYFEICKSIIKEKYVGGIMLETFVPYQKNGKGLEQHFLRFKALKILCNQLKKPIFFSIPTIYATNSDDFIKKLIEIEIPFFQNFERGAKAFLNLYKYQKSKK